MTRPVLVKVAVIPQTNHPNLATVKPSVHSRTFDGRAAHWQGDLQLLSDVFLAFAYSSERAPPQASGSEQSTLHR